MALIFRRRIIIFSLVGLACPLSRGQQPILAPVSSTAKKGNFHIYLLMGQSNMEGRDNRQLATQVDSSRILSFNADGRWVVARDPLHPNEGRTEQGAGPGIPFALEMLNTHPNIIIGLVPCAVGGSPLKRWVKGGDLYQIAVTQAQAAAEKGVIKGVLWHRGESDTDDKEKAESYGNRIAGMIKDLRPDLDQPDIPIVVGQLGEFLTLKPTKYPFVDAVRASIKNTPAVVPHTGYADSTGLGDKGDQLHFSADAQKQMGTRFARAMQQLQK